MQNLVADNTEGDAEEIQILLQNAIQSLPEKQKLVFMMRYYDDLPYEEISKISRYVGRDFENKLSLCQTENRRLY